MDFIVGFLIWIVLAVAGMALARMTMRAEGLPVFLTFIFALFGAFVGGMIGVSAHVFHDPEPLSIGGVIGAVIGALVFPLVYHFVARRAV